jgi:hypothetical protein
MHSGSLEMAVYTTFLVHCPYWPEEASIPSLSPIFASPFSKHKALYTQETRKLTHFDTEDGGSMYL